MLNIQRAYDSVGGDALLDQFHKQHRHGIITDKEHALKCIEVLRERLTRIDDWSGSEVIPSVG